MTTRTIDLRETSAELAELLASASEGEEIIFAEADRPVAKLVVLEAQSARQGRRQFGQFRGQLEMAEDFDEPLAEEFWLGSDE